MGIKITAAKLKAVGHRTIRGTNMSLHSYTLNHYGHAHFQADLTRKEFKALEAYLMENGNRDKAREVLPEPEWTYQKLDEELHHKGHGNSMEKRKVGNNTWLIRGPERISVRLHQTDILTYTPDNRVILNSGNWETVTTKDRMNAFLGWNTVHSVSTVWYVEARFWLVRDRYERGRFVKARVPFESGMTLDVRTHELVAHPDSQFIDIDNSLVLREASDMSRMLSVHTRLLESKVEEGTLTNDDLRSAMRMLDRYQTEQQNIQYRLKSLESSLSWASSRLEDVLTEAMKFHAEENYEQRERQREVKGQERLDVLGRPSL